MQRPRQSDVVGVESWAGSEVTDGVSNAAAVAGGVGCDSDDDRFDAGGGERVLLSGLALPEGDAVRPARRFGRILQVVGEDACGCRGQRAGAADDAKLTVESQADDELARALDAAGDADDVGAVAVLYLHPGARSLRI